MPVDPTGVLRKHKSWIGNHKIACLQSIVKYSLLNPTYLLTNTMEIKMNDSKETAAQIKDQAPAIEIDSFLKRFDELEGVVLS